MYVLRFRDENSILKIINSNNEGLIRGLYLLGYN